MATRACADLVRQVLSRIDHEPSTDGLPRRLRSEKLLLQHDLTHIETIAHVDIPLLMSTLGISLGKAARLHRMATQLAPKVASSIKEANARQRVEL